MATVAQREVIEKILTHLGLPTQPVRPVPAAIEADLFGGVAGYTTEHRRFAERFRAAVAAVRPAWRFSPLKGGRGAYYYPRL